ncbi:MAG: DUF1830 domain-containing protein [Microcoleaceae cyanobacterium]
MAQVLDPLPSNTANRILCCYVNATSGIQIARISNIANWYFERVVFPGQRLIFEAVAEAMLEIHTGAMASAIISDTIPGRRLQIDQDLPIVEEAQVAVAAKAYHQRITQGRVSTPMPEPLMTPALSSVE